MKAAEEFIVKKDYRQQYIHAKVETLNQKSQLRTKPNKGICLQKMEMVLIAAGDGVEYNGKSITGLLSVLFSSTMGLEEKKDVLSRVYGIEMTKEFEREVKDMCNISRAYYEEGLNKGLNEGLIKGSLQILNQLVDKGDTLHL